jgi:flagellar motor switch protein FliN/FliY
MPEMETTKRAAEPGGALPLSLSSMESGTIAEILDISMGAAAAAVSAFLGREVSITTPEISPMSVSELELKSLDPAVGIEIEYVDGLKGSSFMVVRQKDIKAIAGHLMGGVDVSGDGALDEIHASRSARS